MPIFTHTPKVEPIEIDVDIDMFIDRCTHSEVREVMRVIKRDATGIFDSEIESDIEQAVANAMEEHRQEELDESPRSESQRIFNRHIDTLKREWYSITNEDIELIAIIAQKYGSL
jgi:hypothetical protein